MSKKRRKVISVGRGIVIAILTAIVMYGTSVGVIAILTAIVMYVTSLDSRSTSQKHDFICIDQVEYFYSQAIQEPVAPHFKPDGSLYLCE